MTPPPEPGVDIQSDVVRRPRARSEAFLWLTVFGLILLWPSVPIVIGLGGMMDCFGSTEQCQAALDRQATASTIMLAIVLGLTVIAVAAMLVGRRQLPWVLLMLSVCALLLGIVRSVPAQRFRPGYRLVSGS